MAKKKNPNRVHVGTKQLTCPFCEHDQFFQREIRLNTAGMSALGLDWLNQAAEGLVCAECGRVEMFMDNGHLHYEEV